jgi:hypothetical protein
MSPKENQNHRYLLSLAFAFTYAKRSCVQTTGAVTSASGRSPASPDRSRILEPPQRTPSTVRRDNDPVKKIINHHPHHI